MKKYIVLTLVLITGYAFAQEAPVDKMQTTKEKIVQVKEDGKIHTEKVKVITTKEQEVKTDQKLRGTVNAKRVFPPVEVTRTVMVDNDKDPFYDEITKVKYYDMEGTKYAFQKTDDGFLANFFENEEKPLFKARKSQTNAYYFVTYGKNTGIGYFDGKDKFIVEYYDATDNTTTVKVFEDVSIK